MLNKNNFYVTTPIYYGNGLPHVGHFYSSTIANIIYKYFKTSGYNARFTTGIDENSQKAVIKAEEEWLEIMEYLDFMARKHQETWDYFNMDYTDFIRTTEGRHHKLVQEVLQHCFEKGDIYQWIYEWKYCIGCEAFKKDDDLIERNGELVCPDHLKKPDNLKEKNYFFKLSRYQTWMQEFYKANPTFILPDFRFNEVRAFVERGLEDFSISRETNTFGIPLPFDDSQVTYVWFDALFNYYTSCKYSRGWDKNNEEFTNELDFWPANLHVVGKDIIRFHGIFWPAMLASYLDLWEERDGVLHYIASDSKKLPKNILCGGHFTVDGQKMSKSIGNVIDPIEYSEKYSKELLSLYILSAFPIGNDGDYDRKQAILSYNAKLANNLGNLVNRVVVLALKLSKNTGILDTGLQNIQIEADWYEAPWWGNNDEQVQKQYMSLPESAFLSYAKFFELKMKEYDLKAALDTSFQFLDLLNKFTDEREPWLTIKDDEETTRQVLYTLAEGLRVVWLCLYSFFPEKMSEMFEKLGLSGYREALESGKLSELLEKQETFKITKKGNPLFMRFDVDGK